MILPIRIGIIHWKTRPDSNHILEMLNIQQPIQKANLKHIFRILNILDCDVTKACHIKRMIFGTFQSQNFSKSEPECGLWGSMKSPKASWLKTQTPLITLCLRRDVFVLILLLTIVNASCLGTKSRYHFQEWFGQSMNAVRNPTLVLQ